LDFCDFSSNRGDFQDSWAKMMKEENDPERKYFAKELFFMYRWPILLDEE
jgi:hypothetical protein